MCPGREHSPVSREQAHHELRAIIAVRPGLSERALMAAMKGRRTPVTIDQLRDLLRADAFRFIDGGWRLTDALAAPAPYPRQPHLLSDSHKPPAPLQATALTWTMKALRDLLDAADEDIAHALWLLAAQDEPQHLRWKRAADQLRNGTRAALTQADLGRIRSHLNEMRRAQRPSEQVAEVHIQAVHPPASAATPTVAQTGPRAADLASSATVSHPRTSAESITSEADRREARSTPHRATWQDGDGGCRTYQCAPPATHGERMLAVNLGSLPCGLVILSPIVPRRDDDREIDAIVLTPGGVVTVEQKDVPRGTGRLRFPLNASPECDGRPLPNLDGARRQARLHAQTLASLMREDPRTDLGFISAVLSVEGAAEVEADGHRGGVWLSTTEDVVTVIGQCLTQRPFPVSMSSALEALERLGVAALPPQDVIAQQFTAV